MAQTTSSRMPVCRLTSTMLSPDRHRASLSTSPMLTAPPLGSPHRLATRAGFTAQVDISEAVGDSAGSPKKYDPRPVEPDVRVSFWPAGPARAAGGPVGSAGAAGAGVALGTGGPPGW